MMDRKNDKEKLKLIHPKQKQQENSSSDEEKSQQVYLQSTEKIYSSSHRSLPQIMTR
ncbi:hypothetical protein Hdeb2414_s0023g00628611 [Helianthus debilis subsp. tardiflorus]